MKYFQILFISILFFSNLEAQDTIVGVDGKRYFCKVISEDSVNVYFSIQKNTTDVNSYINKNQIDRIIYKKPLKYEDSTHKNLFKLNYVLSNPPSSLCFNYERVINNHTSIQVYVGLPRSNTVYGEEAFEDYQKALADAGINQYSYGGDWQFEHSLKLSTSIAVEFRHYFDEILVSPKGLYYGGGLSYYNQKDKISFTSISNGNETVVDNNINLKMLYLSLGFQFVPVNYLTIDFHANPGYSFGSGTDVYNGHSSKGGLKCTFYFGVGINY